MGVSRQLRGLNNYKAGPWYRQKQRASGLMCGQNLTELDLDSEGPQPGMKPAHSRQPRVGLWLPWSLGGSSQFSQAHPSPSPLSECPSYLQGA